jgi:peptidylprolyl isomerase
VSASAGTLGQPITFTVMVRTAAAAGSPAGTVSIVQHGTVLQTVSVSPTTSSDAKYAYSEATYTLTQQPGGAYFFFGKHPVNAHFIPSGEFTKSSGSGKFTVSLPTYTPLGDGTEIETVIPGSGPGIQDGQMASAFYTGYLAKNGKIFDDSVNDGGTPFPFTVGAGQVITGFDEGTVGMEAGETRLIYIPPAEGYGDHKTGSIPKNSTLIFVLTLESIS